MLSFFSRYSMILHTRLYTLHTHYCYNCIRNFIFTHSCLFIPDHPVFHVPRYTTHPLISLADPRTSRFGRWSQGLFLTPKNYFFILYCLIWNKSVPLRRIFSALLLCSLNCSTIVCFTQSYFLVHSYTTISHNGSTRHSLKP